MRIAIGIDIGGTNTKTVLVSEDGTVLSSYQNPTPSSADESSEDIGTHLVRNLKRFLDRDETRQALSDTSSNIAGIGIGVAGLIDRQKGVVVQSPNIAKLNGVSLKNLFESEFTMPVVVDNDANTYAYGEKWVGAGKNFDNFVLLTLGTGLGGGIIYKGDLYEGPGEIGHMTIVPSGRYCTCGSYGCLESYASGRAIVDRVITSLEKGADSMLTERCNGNFYKVTSKLIYETALDGDSLSREVFREAGQFLGIGIANLINILGLEAVIIGGGLIGAWDMFVEELKKEAMKRAFKPLTANIQILKSTLQENAGSIGAAGFLLRKAPASTPGESH